MNTKPAPKTGAARRLIALDAAPQDGRWLDDPDNVKTLLMFFMSKLSPDDLAQLDTHLADGTTPQATDRRLPEGDLKRDLLNYTPKNRQTAISAVTGARSKALGMDAEQSKRFDEMFPNANRLKGGF